MSEPLTDLEKEFMQLVEEERANLYQHFQQARGTKVTNDEILHLLITQIASLKVHLNIITYGMKKNEPDKSTTEMDTQAQPESSAGLN